MAKVPETINREISWLAFNERVLQEAADSSVPILERLRFLGIFSNNLDEFFRVRVATQRRLLLLGKKSRSEIDYKPKKVLEEVYKTVMRQSKLFETIYDDIHNKLQQKGIYIINEQQLSASQGEYVKNYFNEMVRPSLVPIMLNQVKTFPYIKDKMIYLAIKISGVGKSQYALIQVPTDTVGRFLLLPSSGNRNYIILLDDIIRYNLPEVFSSLDFTSIEAYTIKLTRDAELDIDNDVSQSIVDKIFKSVKARSKGEPVRFVYDQKMPKDLFDYIISKMKLTDFENLIPGGRYHNFKDFMDFPEVGGREMWYARTTPLLHPALAKARSYFDVLKKQDIMLHYPYHNFTHFLDLLREAAIDPNVKSIKITLYRAAKKSKVINALINAAQNGKKVIAVVELQARFDEEANIKWAKQLQDEGIQVIYGVPGLKVHSKLCLISRIENGKTVHYANITTGNYNENTSKVYADDSLLTSDKRITNEVANVFEFFDRNYRVHPYKHLILSPLNTRKKFIRFIDNEIENSLHGKKAGIFIKMNSLVDDEMVNKLYEASNAGVPIRIIIRGICTLVAGIKGQSENIEAISIVDKFLEHSRIYIFENDGEPLYYISSADWMARNLDHRIEVTCPIYSKEIQQMLQKMMDIQWSDNVKARVLDKDLSNKHRSTSSRKKIRAQYAFYEFLKSKSASA